MCRRLILLSVVLVWVAGTDALAQGNPPSSKPQESEGRSYPVTLGDQVLFSIRSVKGYSGEERAKVIEERIKNVAENYHIPVTTLPTFNYQQPITIITAEGELLVAILEEDALAEGRTRQELAAEYTQKLRTAIEQYRRDRSLRQIVTASLFMLLATLCLIVIVYLLNRFYRSMETAIQVRVQSKKLSLHIQAFELLGTEEIERIFIGTMKTIRLFLFLGIFYAYIHLGLSLYPWTQPFGSRLFSYVVVPLKTIGSAVLGYLPNLLFLAIITLIMIYVLKLMGLFFRGVERGSIQFRGFYPEWAQPTYRILRLVIIAFAVVVAFPYIPGSESPAFKGISIFFGLVFSLGSTSYIANIVAGYTLTYRRVFKIGDRVKIADFIGDVVETRLQVTHLRTIKNEEIVVPNSMIVNSHVINYSTLAREKGLILHTTVTIGYDAPWRQVHAMLLMAAEKTSGLVRDPAPFVLQKSLDDFYVTYELNAYTDTPQGMAQIYSELHRNIQDVFNEYGVQIMSPAYRDDPGQPKVVPKERWYAPPASPPGASKEQG
jgi:small-conductance mechanosensitive channel